MKILVFEYITGGGFNKQEMPESLAREGRLMLQALIDNFRSYVENGNQSGIELLIMLDSRLDTSINTAAFETVIIKPEQNSHEEFARLTFYCDAVWPIAPEFDGILQELSQAVELAGKKLLTSPACTVALTGNKLNTYLHLKKHYIVTVPTRVFTSGVSDNRYLLQELIELSVSSPTCKAQQWLVKPIDGVGCADSYIVTDRRDFEQMHLRKGRYVIQPHLDGIKTSLSCLFKQGCGWLLCANLQQFDIVNRQYHLTKIIVNHYPDLSIYQELVNNIANALPELWGYAGIDLIETPGQLFVLEINSRLTTSFVGINAALGINVAESILQLLKGEPAIKAVCNQPITIKVKQNESN